MRHSCIGTVSWPQACGLSGDVQVKPDYGRLQRSCYISGIIFGVAYLLDIGTEVWNERLARPREAAMLETTLVGEREAPWNASSSALSDHEFLRARLMDEYRWSLRRADLTIEEYLRFMQLLAETPGITLVACSDVDLVWHEHLLDTWNYAQDSQRLWGRFLHHRQARTSEEIVAIPQMYSSTRQLYARRFAEEPPEAVWGSTTAAASMGRGDHPAESRAAEDRQTEKVVLPGIKTNRSTAFLQRKAVLPSWAYAVLPIGVWFLVLVVDCMRDWRKDHED
eukprot:TRINITY_DN5723_c0_g1_i1.p1 TRINITY_DN5723_c0_g1~~TRINITY_DN5723_c0_g1_i1.p1  ORF type:complete len:280 (-),score=39.56 TRINITY_DN5723_c0_g1_i1:390-1229(-)